ncbi:dityrosine transporter [Fusarium heterosporum]|uniref:Dityrosine transporter n=1 Tax=Fusarium heterosporum TaxID=42747 RepID=A0A8H5WTK8_FUSHE|nr:dityrosine transporter [Fusarium heterosporum]
MTSSISSQRPNAPDDIRETFPGQDSAEDTKVESSTEETEDTGSRNVVLQSLKYESSWIRRVLTPKNCRWNDDSPPALTMGYCILYALASGTTVANLYYNQPILNKIAATFNVSYEESSQVATLLQSGYAAGIIFVLPLGDILERRPFIIALVLATATMARLCVTNDFTVFRALSFACGATTVTPQLMVPLVGDFAPAHRKSSLLAIVTSGLMLGLLMARLLSGVVTNFTSWRNIYWLACGLQYLVTVVLFCFMPDYPSTNPDGLNYFHALASIPRMMVTEPVLIQACLIAFTLSAVFTSFWTTLTFLLASPPFEYTSLQIGVFSLTGLATILSIPLIGRLIDRYVPLLSTIGGQILALIGAAVGTFTGNFTVAGPVIQAIGIDVGMQTAQVSNRAAIFNINPKARNRVNTAYMALAFAGQLTGTAVGNRLYASGGWKRSGGCSIAFVGLSILISLARGPREDGWFGWKGGWHPRREKVVTLQVEDEEYHDQVEPTKDSTPTHQDQPLNQPQPMTVEDKDNSYTDDPIWTIKLNLRVLSISIDTLLLIIICILAAGSGNDTAPIVLFGPLTAVALVWSSMDSVYLWMRRHRNFSPSTRMYFDLFLSAIFMISSLAVGYFGPTDHQVSGSAPSKDESHLGRRALGCFGIAKVFVHLLLVAVAYYERRTEAVLSKSQDGCNRNEIDLSRDEEERLLFNEESSSDR